MPALQAHPLHPASLVRRLDDRGLAVLLGLLALAARLPFRAEFLVNWDAVNFALGIQGFDLATHQPHPPGYLGWVVLSRGATALTGDPNAAMTLLSVLSGSVATALVFLLARRFVDRRSAVVASLLFSTAPLVWYYSVVALSYMTTGAVALALLLALLTAVQRRSTRHLLIASVLLAVIGALRPTDEALLVPAWFVVAFTFGWRERFRAAAVLGVASLAWVVPLLWLSGGLSRFTSEGSAVADLAGGRTWVLGGNLAGIGQNVGMVAAGLLLAVFGGVVVLVRARRLGVRPFGGLTTPEARVLAGWLVLPLSVYLLIHTGQLGYVIMLLPVVYVGVARALPRVRAAAAAKADSRPTRQGWRRPAAIISAMLLVNTLAFVALPSAGIEMLQMSAAASPEGEDEAVGGPASVDRTRQYDLPANDEHWKAVTALIDRHDPETTAVIAETTSGGSFRHLSYYAKDHNVYGFGWDRTGDLGYLFHARERQTTYSVRKLTQARDQMRLPEDVRLLIVTDAQLIDRWEETASTSMEVLELEDGTPAALVRLDAPGAIQVVNPERDGLGELREGFPVAAQGQPGTPQAAIGVVPRDQVVTPVDDDPSPVPLEGGRMP